MNLQEKMDYAFSAFGNIGIGREATMGAFGSMMGESGKSLNTKAYNPADPFSGSRGIAQHNGPRLDAMESFKSKWGDKTDFRHQVDFIVHELSTTEKRTRDKLRDPNIDRKKASDTWTKSFERPKNPEDKLAERRKNADYISKELSKSVAAIANPDVSPSLSAKAAAAASTAAPRSAAKEAETAKQAAPGFDVGRFGAPSEKLSKAGPADFDMGRFGPAPAGFDMGRFGPAATAPSQSVASSKAAPGFDMGRFGPAEATKTVSPEARAALGYTEATVNSKTAAANAINAAFGMTPAAAPATKSAYRDPMVSVAPATQTMRSAAAETARTSKTQSTTSTPASTSMSASRESASTQGRAGVGSFSDAMDGISGAISGLNRDLDAAGKNLAAGNVAGAFASLSGGPGNPASAKSASQAAQVAEAKAAEAGAKNQSFLDADTNITAAIGTIAGGIFGGAPGAIAGGLVGQGIGAVLGGVTAGFTAKPADDVVDGVTSGFKNAVSSLFGTARDPYSADRAAGMPNGGWNQNSFPNAPNGGRGDNGGDRSGWDDRGSQQTRDAIDSGSTGLW